MMYALGENIIFMAAFNLGRLRGALSVAMALSIPKELYSDKIVAITYTVVLFSMVVQGINF